MGRALFRIFILAPISFVYGMVVSVRNWMFDNGMLKSKTFDIPVITVGNIAVGGTGKTPHTEYIVDMMRNIYHVGVLSRGYRRRTHGFVPVKTGSTVAEVGDEALQIKRKFGDEVAVAVCEKRVKGIEAMREAEPSLNMIVLDDAFQHRYVTPSLSVVLTDYSRPVYRDSLMPLGRLRESFSALNRADVVVVTKCPPDVRPMDLRIVREHLGLYPFQKLFFSTFEYCQPKPVFDECTGRLGLSELRNSDNLLSLTGIENPRPFLRYLRRYQAKVKVMRFPDHHDFTNEDIKAIQKRFESLGAKRKYIVTTEKDAMRLRANATFPDSLKQYIYYIPIRVVFLDSSDSTDFTGTLLQLIRLNKS